MKGRSTPPVASTLLEAMRAIGYSFESAIADLVDNSIAAECSSVDIIFPPSGEPYVAIVDDGRGMSPPELMENMRQYVFTGYATEMAQHAGAALSVAAPRRHQPTISLSERHPDVRCEATSSAAPYWR